MTTLLYYHAACCRLCQANASVKRKSQPEDPIWRRVGVAMWLQVTDYRMQFSKWWVSEWKAVAFPEKGLVFDYYVDETQVRGLRLRHALLA